MYNLDRFCEAVTAHCHQARVFDGKKARQQDLADAINISLTALNKRLHNKDGHHLSHENARAIVRTLAGWETVSSQAEARALLDLVDCPDFTAAEWQAAPLCDLVPDLAAPPAPAPATSPAALIYRPTAPLRVRGRVAELGRLRRLLRQQRCLAITGLHGLGKSTLATLYYTQFEQEGGRCYWQLIDEHTTMRDLAGGFFDAIGQPRDLGRLTADQQAITLLNWLRQQPERYLLVLDNCEALLNKNSVFRREGFDRLLTGLIEQSGNSEAILTSRYLPRTNQGREPLELCLTGLDAEEGALLLRDQQIGELLGAEVGDLDALLATVSTRASGHPLALIYLVQLLRKGYTLTRLLADEQLWRGEIGQNLLGSVYAQLTPHEQQLLQFIAVFGQQPVTRADVAGMLAQLSPPPDKWSLASIERHALVLRRRALVSIEQDSYYLLPLVCQFSYEQLAHAPRYHAAAARYLLSCAPNPSNPARTLAEARPLLRAFEQFCAAADYQAAHHLLDERPIAYLSDGSPLNLVELLHRWGEYQLLASLCDQVLVGENDLAVEQRAAAMSNAGLACYLLGQVEDAGDYQQRALAAQPSDERQLAICLTRLGQANNRRGQPDLALSQHEQARAHAEAAGDRRIQAQCLGNQAMVYGDLALYGESLAQLEAALLLARASGDERGIASYLANLGSIHYKQGAQQAAVTCYAEALAVAEVINYTECKAGLLGNLGLTQMALGDYRQAVDRYERAIALDEQRVNLRSQAINLNNLGYAHEQLGSYQQAEMYYAQAFLVATQSGIRRSACLAQANQGSAYRGLGDLAAAVACNERAWNLAEELQYPLGMTSAANNLTLVYADLGDYQQAIDWGNQALTCASEAKNEEGKAKALAHLGHTYTLVGQQQQAHRLLHDALQIVQRTGNRRNEGQCWHYLADLFATLPAPREAVACYIKAQTLREATSDPQAAASSGRIVDLYQQTAATLWPDLYAAASALAVLPGWLPALVGD